MIVDEALYCWPVRPVWTVRQVRCFYGPPALYLMRFCIHRRILVLTNTEQTDDTGNNFYNLICCNLKDRQYQILTILILHFRCRLFTPSNSNRIFTNLHTNKGCVQKCRRSELHITSYGNTECGITQIFKKSHCVHIICFVI